jgi:hypothetical protein
MMIANSEDPKVKLSGIESSLTLFRNAMYINSKFRESKKALKKLDALEKKVA